MRLILTLLLLFSSLLAFALSPFDRIRPMAERGLLMVGDNADKQTALATLQGSFILGNDWAENPSDIELMGDVVANIICLRHELRGEDKQSLLREFIVKSVVETALRDEYDFELMQNIYPSVEAPVAISASSVQGLLDEAVAKMATGEMAECERILLALYEHTWRGGKDTAFRYKAANKLILFYLRLGLLDNAYRLIRQNKIEMDKVGIVNEDYVETLAYKGLVLYLRGHECAAKCHSEVAEKLCDELHSTSDYVMADYLKVMNGESAGNGKSAGIYDFIQKNDEYFCFLTGAEREQRWGAVADYWESMKTALIADCSDKADIDALLNAFQYEKQLMLRSTVKVEESLRKSGDETIKSSLDSLRQIKLKLASYEYVDRDPLTAGYQRIQKGLLHQADVKEAIKGLYTPCTVRNIQAGLRGNETFIDFGIVSEPQGGRYYAIAVSPHEAARLIPLCTVEALERFVAECRTESTVERVRKMYDSSFLYDNLWRPIADNVRLGEQVYYCPAGALCSIMFDAIGDGRTFIGEDIAFHILSSWESIAEVRKGETYVPKEIATFCDIDYRGDREALILDARKYGSTRPTMRYFLDKDRNCRTAYTNINSLQPLSSFEINNWLNARASEQDTPTHWFTGVEASEGAFKSLQNGFRGALNIFTHAFSFPKDVEVMGQPYLMRQGLITETTDPFTGVPLSMYRCGLLLSGAERVWCERDIISGIDDGILNGEEISCLDLSGIDLIILMACSTGEGDVDEKEGIYGLRRALKQAGCGSMITTAWNVDNEAAGVYMKCFYQSLLKGEGVSTAHRKAQLELIKRYEEPYYWAVFQLVD